MHEPVCMTKHLTCKKKKRVIKPYITRHQNKLHTYFPMLYRKFFADNLNTIVATCYQQEYSIIHVLAVN
jgi:hypothetical protein